MLTKVLKEDVDQHFPIAWPRLQKAVERSGRITREKLLETLKSGDCQLWVSGSLAAVTSISKHPLKTVCLIWLCGGKGLARAKRHLQSIEEWARSAGCDVIEIQGRAGWSRALDGYAQTSVTLEKSL